jgi:biotin carboxyl carrier protein
MAAKGRKKRSEEGAWARRGRVAIQSSHGLSAPLVRLAPEWVEREAAVPSEPGVGEPPIPEFIPHDRPPQRLPEDAFCRSPIAGLVVAVHVDAGQTVKKHQPVMVIEAMKMQNNVGAQVDGVVKSIHVSPGDAVKAGQVLFELD